MKISFKVMTVIAALGTVSVAITGGSIYALAQLNAASDAVDASARQSSLLAMMTQDIMGLNRVEFRVALTPDADTIQSAQKSVTDRTKGFEEKLEKLRNVDTTELVAEAKQIEEIYLDYVAHIGVTMDAATAMNGVTELGPEQQRLAEQALAGRKRSQALEAVTGDLVQKLVEQGSAETAAATKLYETASMVMVVGAILGIIIGIALGLFISAKGIVTPIRKIVDSLKGLAAGDLDTKVFGAERTDEVGEIAATTQVFKDNLIEARRLRDEQERARAEREKRNIVVGDAIKRFESAAEEIVRSVASAATELQASSNVMSASATEAAHQANSVAAAAEQTSANVQSVASATEELAASVREIGARAQESHTVTRSAVDEVTQTNIMVGELETAAQKIGAVVSLIGDIAAQTNLLALNATIEAARAGDSGKGFAVVAGEVKSLAEQAARATEDITREIEGIQGVTRKSVSAMAAISTRINEISSIASTIASAVQEQSSATQEISRNVQEASTGTSEVTSNISGVSAAVNETGSAATQVQSAASELAQQSTILRSEFETFIAVVRAA